jgi:uncharacterized protein (TIGR03437 family)
MQMETETRTLLRASLVFVLLPAAAAFAAAPAIQNVTNGASYQNAIASATWVTITGSNLSSSTRAWGSGDFISGNLPAALDGVSVTINGKPAYVSFISPGQINVLAPDDPTTGTVPVQVTNTGGVSNTFSANKQAAAPALFTYSQLGGRYSVIQAAGTYNLIAPPGALGQSVPTSPAAPGENLILYATGLGPVVSGQSAGEVVQGSPATTAPVTVSMGNAQTPVQFAGLIGPGLYQINVAVPALPSGDAPVVVSVNGTSSSGRAFVPIQAPPEPVGHQTSPPIVDCLTGPVDYITYSTPLLSYDRPDEVSIGGTRLCPTCSVKSPLFPEFTARMERSMKTKGTVQACYDASGNVYQVRMVHK